MISARRLGPGVPSDAQVIKQLYAALNDCDGEAMASLYTDDARFSDPAFGDLEGPQVGAMWRMLTSRAQDLKVEVRLVKAKAGLGEAQWEATYTFAQTGLPVRNLGKARFAFREGKIATHTDEWDFHKWAGQALGFKGKALGWAKPFHATVTKKARAELEKFMTSEMGKA